MARRESCPGQSFLLVAEPRQRRFGRRWHLPAFALAAIALGSCAPKIIPPSAPPTQPAPPAEEKPVEPPKPAGPASAIEAGVLAGPAVAFDPGAAARALAAFRISCPAVTKRQDASGLTRPQDWQAACAAAASATPATAAAFFAQHFETVRVGEGTAFATGYFEPEIAGSRTRIPGYDVPVYRKPADLVEVDAETAKAAGTLRRGRLENGVVVP